MGSSEKTEGEDKENVYEVNDDDEETSEEDIDVDSVANAEDEEDEDVSAMESNDDSNQGPVTRTPKGVTIEGTQGDGSEGEDNSDDSTPLDIGEHYMVRRNDNQWCKYD